MGHKKIKLFDPEVGFYELLVDAELVAYPHLANEAYVLGLDLLQNDGDGTYALGIDATRKAITPWFDSLDKLEDFCHRLDARAELRTAKSRLFS